MTHRLLLASCVLLTLGACSTWRPAPAHVPVAPASDARATATAGRWSGHLGLKLAAWNTQPARGDSFHFDLQGHSQAGVLDISTPFGTLVASVRWTPEGASLLTPDETQVFGSMEELMVQAVGEALPVSTLMFWLKGQPDPQLPVTWTHGRALPLQFEQSNWQVDASELAQGVLRAQRPPQAQQRGAQLVIRLDE